MTRGFAKQHAVHHARLRKRHISPESTRYRVVRKSITHFKALGDLDLALQQFAVGWTVSRVLLDIEDTRSRRVGDSSARLLVVSVRSNTTSVPSQKGKWSVYRLLKLSVTDMTRLRIPTRVLLKIPKILQAMSQTIHTQTTPLTSCPQSSVPSVPSQIRQ